MVNETGSTQSPREVYATKCNAHRCNKNSQLMKSLPDSHQWDLLTELDLNLNFVGRVGIRPVLEVVKLSPNVRKLCLADNFLNNESVKDIVTALVRHPSLGHLDLSRNPISHAAGKMLSHFAVDSQALHTVLLEETLINPALIRIIQKKAASKLEGHQSGQPGFVAADSVPAAAAAPLPVAASELPREPVAVAAPPHVPEKPARVRPVPVPASDPTVYQAPWDPEPRTPTSAAAPPEERNEVTMFAWKEFMAHTGSITDDWLGSLQLLTEAFHPGVHVRMDRQSSVIERHNSTYQGDMLNLVFHVAESTSGEVWQGLPLLYHLAQEDMSGAITALPLDFEPDSGTSMVSSMVDTRGTYLYGLDIVKTATDKAQGEARDYLGLRTFLDTTEALGMGYIHDPMLMSPRTPKSRFEESPSPNSRKATKLHLDGGSPPPFSQSQHPLQQPPLSNLAMVHESAQQQTPFLELLQKSTQFQGLEQLTLLCESAEQQNLLGDLPALTLLSGWSPQVKQQDSRLPITDLFAGGPPQGPTATSLPVLEALYRSAPNEGLRLLVDSHHQGDGSWYAMDLIWTLVQKEPADHPEGWNGLASVMSLIQDPTV
eukprot:CAMPEP_0174307378 /NCGR_PEP_ID=MMETSP0810-20121108/1080_1 /TAXON_ID=73025 ORGANISM="Eutreptiella gymnastica-like, Strain CCMP1594" /NCGR_SAMPLE_ID=MMETSP0810 /ASSEMBLY_ACC=CAM_ASM_000659 /LENGTH=599 /DNA_ID=CAMNT_0015414411 /DNA_START=63 /DNA_END=1862 /DNA_ORIENTATION=+